MTLSLSRGKLIAILIFLAMIDLFIPIPFFAIAALYIVIKRPVQFLDAVRRFYAEKS